MKREYRDWVKGEGLVKTIASIDETDLCIMGDRALDTEAAAAIHIYRNEIEGYIKKHPEFKDTLRPLKLKAGAPEIVKRMAAAGEAAGVGPMAAVAGAVAEFVGRELLKFSSQIIVENGGDIFIKSSCNRRFGIFAGSSPLTGKLTFEIISSNTPLGVCTSSGTVGHSMSFGKADAACIISRDTALADAAATATGNITKSAADIEKAIGFAKSIPGILGVIVVVGNKFGSWGKVTLSCPRKRASMDVDSRFRGNDK